MNNKKAAKVLIKRAKLNPKFYSSAEILYAKKLRKNIKNEEQKLIENQSE